MVIRLAFTGASGTGKSKLTEWLRDELHLPMNPVGSRTVAKAMGFDNPYDVDKAGRRAEFQFRLVDDKRGWEDTYESFVTDRTTIDNLAYTILHDIYAVNRDLLQRIVGGLERYTHVAYCPQSVFFSLANDPHRVGGGVYQADESYHQLYDLVVLGLLDRYLPKTVKRLTVNVAGFEARQDMLREFLGV